MTERADIVPDAPTPPVTLAEMIEEVSLEISYREHSLSWRAAGVGLALQNKKRRRLEIMREVKRFLEAERSP